MSNGGVMDWFRFSMRTGRKVERTLYLRHSSGREWLVGLVDTPDLAAEIVARWNAAANRATVVTEVPDEGNATVPHLTSSGLPGDTLPGGDG